MNCVHSSLLKVEKFFFFPLQTTSYPLHTTTYARLCKTSLNSTKRLRVVCSEGPNTISPAHATDPGTGDDDPFGRRRPRPIGRNSGRDPSTREAKARKNRFLDTPPNDPKQKEIQYSINIDSIVTGQGRNGRSSAKAVFNCLDRIARRHGLLRAGAPGDAGVSHR